MFHDVTWHRDGAKLAAASSDGQIWIWDATRGFERDTSPRALPYIDRQLTSGTARGEDRRWFTESYVRAGRLKDARVLLEQSMSREPENSLLAAELSEILLLDATPWTVLQPTQLISQLGATLMVQRDGSILASGVNTPGDVYTLHINATGDRIAAIRVEALPDSSLPNNGPGTHISGNFQLSALRLYYPAAEGEDREIPLPLTAAWASFDYKAWDADVAGIVDPSLNKVWHVWGRTGEAHRAVILLQDPAASKQKRTLVIELRHKDFGQGINLGRFRLSASTDPAILKQEQRLDVIRKLTDPWAKLATAYHILGDQPALDNLLQHHPAAMTGIGDLYAADQNWERAIAAYNQYITAENTNVAVLAKRAAAYIATQSWELALSDWRRVVAVQPNLLRSAFQGFLNADRWNEATEFGLQFVQRNPNDELAWLQIAPALVLADDQQAYADFCARMAVQFAESTDMATTERTVKACLLRPNTIDCEKLPAHIFSKTLDDGTAPDWFLPWGWSTRALWAYRRGDAELAVTFVTKSEESQPGVLSHAENLAVMALAQHQLQHPADARRALDEAAQLIPRLQSDETHNGNHDLLIAEILFREAEALINAPRKP
ncbi:MAG: hypothetical protein JSS02_34060 [Planctomycetes bacterium]|nr:hypothetical protein [Planctomycetota bacterium]